jgi:pimeloyl-ACP methyl ester carboxylesterase
MGRRLPLHSWGYRGQIADLARMPEVVATALPWLRFDRDRVYAVGGSMGGHETLLLVGQYPELLAGAVAIDSVTNFYRRYDDFGLSPKTIGLQALAMLEVGGTPRTNAVGYVLRSATHWTRQVAGSGVPLSIWWSVADQVVQDQIHQSAAFYDELRSLGPRGRLESTTGFWTHSQSFTDVQLPGALRWLGLLR